MTKAFLYIIQKFFMDTHDKIDIPCQDNLTFEETLHINSKIFYGKTSTYNDTSKFYYYQYLMSPKNNKTIHEKYQVFKQGIDNIFSNQQWKTECITIFNRLQTIYRGFTRLAFIYKFKKAKTQVTTDLFMNELNPTDRNVVTLFDNNSKYMFTITDLVNIFYTSLCNAPYFIPSCISCKNPYNNIPFTKANLYNIYFFLLFNKVSVPTIIRNYFLCNFNLRRFQSENKRLIHEHAIIRYVNNSPSVQLHSSILDMIYEHNRYKKKIKIHHEFPLNKLVEIMRPYLLLYYKSKYSGYRYLNRKYDLLLSSKMKEFILFNPKFGKKNKVNETFFNSSIDVGYTHFNESHIKFKLYNEDRSYFSKSHLSTELDSDASDDDTMQMNDLGSDEAELEMSF